MKRNYNYNVIKDLENKFTSKILLDIFKKICKIRYFENEIKILHEQKKITPLVYLSLGQESVSAAISVAMKGSFVLAQHRGHGPYLAFGGNPTRLIDELLGLESGCCKGKGGSPMIHDIKKKIIGHCGLIGDQVPIAAGMSLVKKNNIFTCFFGDGAAEEDYVLSTIGYAATQKLKILFVCDDNNLSVLTPIEHRRSWEISRVAESFGIPAVDIADDPLTIYFWAEKFKKKLPALINIRTCRDIWHVGSGKDKVLEWNRYNLTKQKFINAGLKKNLDIIEMEEKNWARSLVRRRLQRL
jgi:pyruvate dehydrogenase E1 component alpha subunit